MLKFLVLSFEGLFLNESGVLGVGRIFRWAREWRSVALTGCYTGLYKRQGFVAATLGQYRSLMTH